ncbi:hypothetical protein [Streptomyces sp. NPDC085529]|uniref:hypothetical protein n=1 Tax=Streptomyces sp. NPDC085529 TaxID=3365729 RepID=UPI0037D47A6D
MSHPDFDLPPLAPPDVLAEWNDLADQVCRELLRAGLPAHRSDRDDDRRAGAGVAVHVDRLADGGVFADWTTSDELCAEALGLYARGIDHDDPPPAVRHHDTVHVLMRDALTGILASAGFEVAVPDPHTYGSTARVTGRRP